MRETADVAQHGRDDSTRLPAPPGTRAIGLAGAALLLVGQALIVTHARPLSDLWYSFVWFGFVLAADAVVAWRTGASLLTRRRADAAFMLVASAALWWSFEALNVKLFASWSYSPSPDVSLTAQRIRASVAFASLLPATLEAGMLAALVRRRPRDAPHATAPRPPESSAPAARAWFGALCATGVAALGLAWRFPVFALPLALVGLFLVADATNALRARPSLLARARAGDVRFAVALFTGNVLSGLCGEAWNSGADPKWTYDVPYAGELRIFEMPLPGYGGYGALALALFALYHAARPRFRGAGVPAGHPLDACGLA